LKPKGVSGIVLEGREPPEPPMGREKVPLDLDKHEWHPSVLPGQIVVVSTVNEHGEPNLAPKSWIMMAAFAGPVIALGCNVGHTTYRNILATGEFVVNIPGEPLAERIFALLRYHGMERTLRSGFTLGPAERVRPPIVQECRAHLECELESVKGYGEEVVIFGKVLAARMDAECRSGEKPEQYFTLRPIFFLEDETYGSIDTAKMVGRAWPTEQRLFMVEVWEPQEPPARGDVLREHLAFLHGLRARGLLLVSGPFSDDSERGHGEPLGGMYVIRAASRAEAEELAREDPLVRSGGRFRVRTWTRTF
jgi:flavin reductase (DIM6/NTAB) family NADH-FMN oxidoreductase RutF/uncharacterized protein YciI